MCGVLFRLSPIIFVYHQYSQIIYTAHKNGLILKQIRSECRMIWAKHLIVLVAVLAISTTQVFVSSGCSSGQLKVENDWTPKMKIEKAITLQIRPQSMIKNLSLQILLGTANGEELYGLELDASMSLWWDDVQVTMKDISTSSNILKVVWPPILLPLAWTTLHLNLQYQELLQIAAVPHDAIVNPKNSSVPHNMNFMPVVASVKLKKTGIATLRLKLLTANISVDYSINCGQEYLVTAFAPEFDISSSMPMWRTWVWILIGVVAILLVLMAVTLQLFCSKLKIQSPKSFTLAHFQSCSHSDGISPILVSASQGGRRPVPDGTVTAEMDRIPRITVGIVSSRAPSPGRDVEENTFDYINQTFSHE